MPVEDTTPRRSVVPAAAGRSLWLSAAWTGAGSAVLGSLISITVVAVIWLPAAGARANAGSAIRAGILTFLAGLHGGITVDGEATAFVPLGLTVLVGAIAWRAGTGLADAAEDLGETDPRRLVRAGLLQLASFVLACTLLAGFGSLGTSHVALFAALVAATLLFAITGGVAFAHASALADDVVRRWSRLGVVVRTALAGVGCYLGAGSLLVAGSLVVHHQRVEVLSAQVGGGVSGVPVLLLGLLAAPNIVIGGAAYLAGPGFAIGHGSGVALDSTVHGTLPAFPVLGALPVGKAPLAVWLFALAVVLLAGLTVAVRSYRSAGDWAGRFRHAAAGIGVAAVLGVLLGWQGGGALGPGRLSAFGASPWQLGLAFGLELGVVAGLGLGVVALVGSRRTESATQPARRLAAVTSADADGARSDEDDDTNDRYDTNGRYETDDARDEDDEDDEESPGIVAR